MNFSDLEFQRVNSSNLDLVAFVDDALYISFKGGGLYEYKNATKELYEAMLSAPSVGKFFHANIRGKLPYKSIPLTENVKLKVRSVNVDNNNINTKS